MIPLLLQIYFYLNYITGNNIPSVGLPLTFLHHPCWVLRFFNERWEVQFNADSKRHLLITNIFTFCGLLKKKSSKGVLFSNFLKVKLYILSFEGFIRIFILKAWRKLSFPCSLPLTIDYHHIRGKFYNIILFRIQALGEDKDDAIKNVFNTKLDETYKCPWRLNFPWEF